MLNTPVYRITYATSSDNAEFVILVGEPRSIIVVISMSAVPFEIFEIV